MRLSGRTAEIILVSLLGLVHFRVALAVLVLGRTGRIDQRCIDDGAGSDRPRSPRAIDDSDAGRQLVFLQQAAEVENGGFVGDALGSARQTGAGSWFRQRFLHRWIAVAEPVLQQMHTQHRHQRVGRTATFTLRIMWLDQSNQALPRHHRSISIGTTPCGFACACQRTRRRRRSSASSGNSVGGGAVFCQIRKSFQSFLG
ncbi:hypothetical protein BANRA_05302 [Klebsiella pneumoniae]|nr:hypothetical protein BANRA_05302 [Klebsiella pneumoniae]